MLEMLEWTYVNAGLVCFGLFVVLLVWKTWDDWKNK